MLYLRLSRRNRTFAIKSPFGSFIWLLQGMRKFRRLKSVELVLLHQCVYGAFTQKRTGILTSAPWMKAVGRLCAFAVPHHHLIGGLTGKVRGYVDDRVVWRTPLAAEYPCGLCVPWSNALLQWLKSTDGVAWMSQRSFLLTGRWNNCLVKASIMRQQTMKESEVEDFKSRNGGQGSSEF